MVQGHSFWSGQHRTRARGERRSLGGSWAAGWFALSLLVMVGLWKLLVVVKDYPAFVLPAPEVVLRRLVLSGAEFDMVASSDAIVRSCRGAMAVAPDGTIYYATDSELRKIEIGEGEGGEDGGAEAPTAAPGDGDGGETPPAPPAFATPPP